jgi:hypothetical protein
MLLGGEWLRDDVAGMPFANASPHMRHARPPGIDIGGVSVCEPSGVALKHIAFAARPCRRQAALQGAPVATSPYMICLKHHFAFTQGLIHGASPNITSRNGVDVGEVAAKIVPARSDRLKCRDADCADMAFVGARRPCKTLLWRPTRPYMICP